MAASWCSQISGKVQPSVLPEILQNDQKYPHNFLCLCESVRPHLPASSNWFTIQQEKEELICLHSLWNISSSVRYVTLIMSVLAACNLKLTGLCLCTDMEMYTLSQLLTQSPCMDLVLLLTFNTHTELINDSGAPWTCTAPQHPPHSLTPRSRINLSQLNHRSECVIAQIPHLFTYCRFLCTAVSFVIYY